MTRRLLTGATVWAGASCAPQPAWLLIEDDHVAALGQPAQPPPAADQVLDLAGCHVLPGLVDVHLHLSQAAWFPPGEDGWGWGSLAEALHAVRAAATAAPEPQAPWLLVWRVARWRWPEGRLPTARELDEAAPGRRVLVSTIDMHRGAISSAGLATLGLALDGRGRGRAAVGGDVTCDRRGRPTGELWEAAYALALQRALADTLTHAGEAGAHAALEAEATRCLAAGITHAHDPYVAPDWHPRMVALRAATALRLSWGTGAPAGMHARPPGPTAAPSGRRGGCGPPARCGRRCAASWSCAPPTCTPRTCATPTPSWPAWSPRTRRPGSGCASTRSVTSPASRPPGSCAASTWDGAPPPSTTCCCSTRRPPTRSPAPAWRSPTSPASCPATAPCSRRHAPTAT